jgi:hypothetical protein
MAKSEAQVTKPVLGRPGTLMSDMSDEDFAALPPELQEQIAKSPSPKDSIGYYFDQLCAELKTKEAEEDRRFNAKDVLVWAYQKSDNRVFKIQSVRTVLKQRITSGQIGEVAGTPGRDKVYQVA